MITDWQNLPIFVVLITSFVLYWILFVLMPKSVAAFNADCLHLLFALPSLS